MLIMSVGSKNWVPDRIQSYDHPNIGYKVLDPLSYGETIGELIFLHTAIITCINNILINSDVCAITLHYWK